MPASLNGVEFRNNPYSINWDYAIKMSSTKTIGGKVHQLYGTKMGDLTVRGKFASIEEQKEWFNRIKDIFDSHSPTQSNPRPSPVRFFWPERRWDFMVYIKSFTQEGASTAISATNASFAPGWSLTMFVYDDNGDIVKLVEQAAESAYLRRITAGLGWQQSKWNGPTDAEFEAVLEGRGTLQYLFDRRAQIINESFVAPPTGRVDE